MSNQLQDQSPEEILKELEEYFDMFETSGWQRLVKVYKERMETYKDKAYQTHASNDDWQFLRGYLTVLDSLVNFEENIKRGYDEVKESIAESELEDDGDEL